MVSIMELAMKKGWRWWCRRIPSSEPRTNYRLALPMKNRRWRRLRIVKCDATFSLVFSWGKGIYRLEIRVNRATWVPQGNKACLRRVAAPFCLVGNWWPPSSVTLAPVFFIYSIKISKKFCMIPKTFISAQKQHHDSSAENNASSG